MKVWFFFCKVIKPYHNIYFWTPLISKSFSMRDKFFHLNEKFCRPTFDKESHCYFDFIILLKMNILECFFQFERSENLKGFGLQGRCDMTSNFKFARTSRVLRRSTKHCCSDRMHFKSRSKLYKINLSIFGIFIKMKL